MVPSSAHPATLWGIGGVVILLTHAVWRLAPLAAEPFVQPGFSAWHWAAYVGFAVFMGWSEGYRGFQKAFAPRVVARAARLPEHPRWTWLLAPAVCMGLIYATRKRLVVSWVLLAAIVLLVVGVRRLPWEWRAIVDAGVVVGLGWGTTALIAFAIKGSSADPEFPA